MPSPLLRSLFVAALFASTPALAQNVADPVQETALTAIADTDLLESLYNATDSVSAALFAPAFLAEVPFDQMTAIMAQLRETMGPTITVTGGPQDFVGRSETHTIAITLVRDDLGRVAGLFFAAPDASGRSLDDILAEIAALAPDAAWLVTRDGDTIAGQNQDVPLAVGSAFKLGVLKALRDAIEAGDLGWNDVFLLEDSHRSLPSGILQAFAVDSPLTVATIASLMISQSDNTATDMLIDILGRDAVGEALGIADPLTTREFFVLKADAGLREDWLARDPEDDDATGALFRRIAETPLPAAGAVTTPHNQGVEWYLSLETLCALATEVENNDVFAINPGPVRPGDWQRVAYKGGSELGVLNLTAHLLAADGTTYCAAITLNAPEAVDQAAAVPLFTALTARLAEGAFGQPEDEAPVSAPE